MGEASYNSNITVHSEVLPVSVDLMGESYPFHFSPQALFPETLVCERNGSISTQICGN